jgi:WD40 repeat protein
VEFSLNPLEIRRIIMIDAVHQELTRFDKNADLVVSLIEGDCPPEPWYSNSECYAEYLWELHNGTSIGAMNIDADVNDIAFTADGAWLVTAAESVGIHDPRRKRSGTAIIRAEESGSFPVTAVATNRSGTKIAYAYSDGLIEVIGWNGTTLSGVYPQIGIGPIVLGSATGKGKVSKNATQIAFSPNQAYLAVLYEDGLDILDISSASFKPLQNIQLPQNMGGVIEFHPTLPLLAIGLSDGIRILEVPDLNLAKFEPGSRVTSIDFSEDGCLLAWGDVDGNIKLMTLR